MKPDAAALELALRREVAGEVRFDAVTRALYSTDASVYQLHPIGVVVPKSRDDLIRTVRIATAAGCPITMRGGGTSQAGQAIGEGLVVDTSKYLNAVLELDVAARRVRVEPGIVLDDLNRQLLPHRLRFAPDISTASRATIGGMMANNSSGARSVIYGKTIDHVIAQEVLLADGTVTTFRDLDADELDAMCDGDSFESHCYREVRRLAQAHRTEIEQRFPKVLRRVGGYNLDAFTGSGPFNLARMMVGSEGTLGVVLSATLNLVPLPAAKAVMAIQFTSLLESLAATPLILEHRPSAIEVMDEFILNHTKQNAAIHALRQSFIEGDPGALLCVEFYADHADELPPRLQALERALRAAGCGYRFHHALEPAAQARVWSLREVALGLSMAMKDDAKSISFVEDAAVAPERLHDYIARLMDILRRHGAPSGVYAHASVGCLHVRPVVNLKTSEGVATFEAIASEVADLVLEFGGALSGEHGDGLVRSPFMERMFGPTLYRAFRDVKRVFDPQGLFNPGKIVDAPPLASNLRFGAGYRTPAPATFFDFTDYGGLGGAVEMCSGLGVCRKTHEGTMCPSYMATRDEQHSTRGRANVLRLAMSGRMGEAGLDDKGVYEALDLCLECRACRSECPVGVDVGRFKSEFLAGYWQRHGTPLGARALGGIHRSATWGSRLAPLVNAVAGSGVGRRVAQHVLGIDARRRLPAFAGRTLTAAIGIGPAPDVVLFADTFTNHFDPHVGTAALEVLGAAGVRAGLVPNGCCGRPQISKGLLAGARTTIAHNTALLHPHAEAGRPIVFCEPSCLSAVREDAPALLGGDDRRRAQVVARQAVLFEEFLQGHAARLPLRARTGRILLHGHCHQKSMGLVSAARDVLGHVPLATVVDLDAGCCGMAGSFGYTTDHYDVSKAIGERRLFPAVRAMGPDDVVVAAGTSCRHQVFDFTGTRPLHPATLLQSLLLPQTRS
jgi:FAD/FMN-containing dehydrogenase/Fe-S oxidoreductase